MTAVYGAECVVQGFTALQTDVQLRVAELRARGDTLNANRVLDAYVALRNGLDALSVKMAARGTEILREHERNSRVRPEGTLELEHALFCEPLSAFGVHGSVGIANYDILDAQTPWWWTQELGYAGNVGRIIFGAFFHPGPETRPSPQHDKEHALFEPRASSGQRREEAGPGGEIGKRGSMQIHKEIAAKHFLESATRVIEAEWLAAFDTLMGAYVAEVALIP